MTIEIAAHAAIGNAAAGGAGAAAPAQAGYGVSLTDFSGFQQAMAGAVQRLEAHQGGPSLAAQQLMKPFDHINTEAANISREANVAKAEGREMTPSETVMLTVRCSEFMFHCQLTSNIANRTSDGLSQLFRQQS